MKSLSKKLYIDKGSIRLEFSEAITIEYSDSLFNEVKKSIDDLRGSSWPDKGLGIILVDTKRINNDGIKLILNMVNYIIKNNNVNMDIWVNTNVSPDVKGLLKNIRIKKEEKEDRSIRIREYQKTKSRLFFFLNWISGLIFIILGSTSIVTTNVIKTSWIEGANSTQLIGGLMVVVSMVPFTFEYIKKYILLKKEE